MPDSDDSGSKPGRIGERKTSDRAKAEELQGGERPPTQPNSLPPASIKDRFFQDRLARTAQAGDTATDETEAEASVSAGRPKRSGIDLKSSASKQRDADTARARPRFATRRIVAVVIAVTALCVAAFAVFRPGVIGDAPQEAADGASSTTVAGAASEDQPKLVDERVDTQRDDPDDQPTAPDTNSIAAVPPSPEDASGGSADADQGGQGSYEDNARNAAPSSEFSVIDGDSFRMPTDEIVRIYNIDTPSVGSGADCPLERALGEKTVARLRDLLAECPPVLGSSDRDRRGRIDALVEVCGEDLGQLLIREGLATFRGLAVDWCN